MSSGHFLSMFFPGGGKHFSSYYFFAISLQSLAFSCTVFLWFCISIYNVAFIDMQTKLTLTSLPFTNQVSLIGGLEGCEVQLRLSQSPGLYKRPLFASDRESLIWGAFVGTAKRIEYKSVGFSLSKMLYLLWQFYSWMCNFCSKVFSLCFFFPDLFPLERDYPGVTKNTLNPQNLFGKVLSKFPMGIHHAFRDQA